MKVLWIDPFNTNAQFLNLVSIILREAGHEVHVCSVARAGVPPPSDVRWKPFMRLPEPPVSLKSGPFTAGRLAVSHPFNWLRAIRYARALQVKALLVTTNLRLPRLDTWAMRRLARHGLAPVVIVHRPHQTWSPAEAPEPSTRYRSFIFTGQNKAPCSVAALFRR